MSDRSSFSKSDSNRNNISLNHDKFKINQNSAKLKKYFGKTQKALLNLT